MSPVFSARDVARFHAKVEKGDGCWAWKGSGHKPGKPYWVFWAAGRTWMAHRVSWMLVSGDIPDGLFICHHCDNHQCVRPDHLFLGTNSDNITDAARKGRVFGQRQCDDVRRGTRHGQAKLNPDAVQRIRELHAQGTPKQQIAGIFGVSRRAVGFVLSGETWGHVGQEPVR